MTTSALANWHQIVKSHDLSGLAALLDDNVVFYSPLVHTPQAGKTITTMYLSAASHVLNNESFQYVRELASDTEAVLEFTAEIDGISVNGVDMIKWNDRGKIVEFKVMLRPLKAIDLVHRKMAEMLEK